MKMDEMDEKNVLLYILENQANVLRRPSGPGSFYT